MARTDGPPVSRAVSRDGTEIGYWTSGSGPPVVFVHGTTADHTSWRLLLPYLEPLVTVHAVDRRGRGTSGDGPHYDVRREFEDVAAVVDAVATDSGSAVGLFGNSFGAVCALGGASLTSNVGAMVLYEPYLNPDESASPPGFVERLEALLAAGDNQAVLETFYREGLRMSDEEVDRFRSLPSWQPRVAAAHTVPRELRAEESGVFDPAAAANVTAPTLMLVGSDSPGFVKADTETVAAALPDARITVLEGQGHMAHYLIPETFAGHVAAFVRDCL